MYGLPEEWWFDHPHWLVKLGVQFYRASGKRVIPNIEDLTAHKPEWISDILLADEILEFYGNDDPIVAAFEKQHAQGKRGLGTDFIPQNALNGRGKPTR